MESQDTLLPIYPQIRAGLTSHNQSVHLGQQCSQRPRTKECPSLCLACQFYVIPVLRLQKGIIPCFLTPAFSGARNSFGRNDDYITPTFLGVPEKRAQNQKWLPGLSGARNWAEWLHKPCLLRVPTTMGTKKNRGLELGGMDTQTLPSWGSPNNGDQIRTGYVTPAFSGARNWVEWLHNPYLLGGPPTMGTKLEVAVSSVPF